MRLRSQRDTVPLSFEEMLTDFDPHTLDEPFDWVVKVRLSLNLQPSLCLLNEFGFLQGGSCVWVNDPCLGWRRGTVLWQSETVFDQLVSTLSYRHVDY